MATTLEELLERIRADVGARPLAGPQPFTPTPGRLRLQKTTDEPLALPPETEQAAPAPAAADVGAAVEEAGGGASPAEIAAAAAGGPGGFTAESLLAAIKESQKLSTGSQLGFALLSGLPGGDPQARGKFLQGRRKQALEEQALGRKLTLEDVKGTRETALFERETTKFTQEQADSEAGRNPESNLSKSFREALIRLKVPESEVKGRSFFDLSQVFDLDKIRTEGGLAATRKAAAATAKAKAEREGDPFTKKFREEKGAEEGRVLGAWSTKGRSTFDQGQQVVRELIGQLERKEILTGTKKLKALGREGAEGFLGRISDEIQDAVAARDSVRNIVGSTLRATLGAQFAEKEGERIFAQTFNLNQSNELNIKKLKTYLTDRKREADTNNQKIALIEQGKSIENFVFDEELAAAGPPLIDEGDGSFTRTLEDGTVEKFRRKTGG